MRQVDRATVAYPAVLQGDLTAVTSRVATGGVADGGIYRHPDVVTALRALYLDKCCFCEEDVGDRGVVEHFVPWHPQYPGRAYDWYNLNYCCDPCNQRKRRGPYRVPSNPKLAATATLLLDPSNPPANLVDLLEFENLEAKPTRSGQGLALVVKTVQFLNDSRPRTARTARWMAAAQVLIRRNHRDDWIRLAAPGALDTCNWDNSRWLTDTPALEAADSFFDTFLHERAPYQSSIRLMFESTVQVGVPAMRRMSNAIRVRRGLPIL